MNLRIRIRNTDTIRSLSFIKIYFWGSFKYINCRNQVPDHVWHGVGFCLGLNQYIWGTRCHPVYISWCQYVPTRLYNSSTCSSSAHAHMPNPCPDSVCCHKADPDPDHPCESWSWLCLHTDSSFKPQFLPLNHMMFFFIFYLERNSESTEINWFGRYISIFE